MTIRKIGKKRAKISSRRRNPEELIKDKEEIYSLLKDLSKEHRKVIVNIYKQVGKKHIDLSIEGMIVDHRNKIFSVAFESVYVEFTYTEVDHIKLSPPSIIVVLSI